jgi:hypothetical protein
MEGITSIEFQGGNMQTITIIQDALLKPFPRQDIEFRVCRVSSKSAKAQVLAYITARGIMQRLDDIFGITGWKDDYEILQGGVKCTLTLKIGNEQITKSDAASLTNIEPIKGAVSDSLKRAGVKFGIGRYLYDLPECWVDLLPDKPLKARNPIHYHSSDNYSGWWEEPDLPTWALPALQDTGQKTPDRQTSPVQDNLHLSEQVKELLDKGLITETKFQSLMKTIQEKGSSQALMRHIATQMGFIQRWDSLSQKGVIDTEAKKDLYSRIITADGKSLKLIGSELDAYERRAA